jgi:hypothetical protein
MGFDDEQRFLKKFGKSKCDRLQRVWDNSYPTSIWGGTVPKRLDKKDVFAINAKKEGFSKAMIEAFLKL